MRKDIKKILTFGILLSIINGSIIPVFAAETVGNLNQSKSRSLYGNIENTTMAQNVQMDIGKKILTLNKAIEAAINNSDKLKLKSKEINMYEDKMDLQEKTNDYYEAISQKVYDFPYDTLKLQEKQTKQSKDFMEDQISSDITNKYNDMVLKEIEINKSKRNLEFKKKDLSSKNCRTSR